MSSSPKSSDVKSGKRNRLTAGSCATERFAKKSAAREKPGGRSTARAADVASPVRRIRRRYRYSGFRCLLSGVVARGRGRPRCEAGTILHDSRVGVGRERFADRGTPTSASSMFAFARGRLASRAHSVTRHADTVPRNHRVRSSGRFVPQCVASACLRP